MHHILWVLLCHFLSNYLSLRCSFLAFIAFWGRIPDALSSWVQYAYWALPYDLHASLAGTSWRWHLWSHGSTAAWWHSALHCHAQYCGPPGKFPYCCLCQPPELLLIGDSLRRVGAPASWWWLHLDLVRQYSLGSLKQLVSTGVALGLDRSVGVIFCFRLFRHSVAFGENNRMTMLCKKSALL